MPTVGAILDESAVFLNDSTKSRFTYAVLLPYVKRAYKQLQLELHLNDVGVLNEVSTLITVASSTLSLGVNQPSDLIEPIWMGERDSGTTQTFSDMVRREWEPETEMARELRYWTWREETILFVGATSERQVKLRYLKGLTAITDENSNVAIIDAELFMAPYTAGLAAKYIGENFERGQQLMNEGSNDLNKIIRRNVKKRQRLSVRRKSFSSSLRGSR